MEVCAVWVCRGAIYKHRLCAFHYHQKSLLRQHCVKQGCKKPLFLNLMCRRHFYLEYGRCLVQYCNAKPYCGHRCRKHYREHAKVNVPQCKRCHRDIFVNNVCSVHILPRCCVAEGCIKPVRAKGLCSAHYYKERRSKASCEENSSFAFANPSALTFEEGNHAGSDNADSDKV